jgi:tetratricopeptide (TPR) repeat protein
MKTLKIFAFSVAILTSATFMRGSVPIIVTGGAGRRAMANLCNKAEEEFTAGNFAGAKRDVDTILHYDPEYWPALYVRAKIFVSQGQYQLAIQDCNEALRKYRGFVEASCLRASINALLGKYAEALRSTIILFRLTLGLSLLPEY